MKKKVQRVTKPLLTVRSVCVVSSFGAKYKLCYAFELGERKQKNNFCVRHCVWYIISSRKI